MTRLEIRVSILSLDSTWTLRLLVMAARFRIVVFRLAAMTTRFVFTFVCRSAGMSHSPNEPCGSRRFSVMTVRLVSSGCTSVTIWFALAVSCAVLVNTV